MKYCPQCGEAVQLRVPAGDDRQRHVCVGCGAVHYQNPKIVTGCLAVHEQRVLLCKRAIAPRAGLWTLPAGFLENGETTMEGAIRETLEEARARVAVHGLYTIFNLPHISQIYMFFRAQLADLDFSAGAESTDVRLFDEQEIPWDELAFPVIKDTLEHYFRDRRSGIYPVHMGDVRGPRR